MELWKILLWTVLILILNALVAAAIEQARRQEMREHRQNTGCRLTHRLKTTPWEEREDGRGEG